MALYPFSAWLPDQAATVNQGVVDVRNALPGPSGYAPFRALVPATDALAEQPLGAVQALDQTDTAYQYAGGAAALYENVDGTWTDRSKSGGYSTAAGEIWEFAAWKNKMLATNFTDAPQAITFGGTEFADLTTELRARHIAVVRNFVVFANTFDAVDGAVPSRVRWSAFDDETDYTVSPVTLSDYEDLKTSKILRIFGGEYGVILQPESVTRMTFIGAPAVFQFDEVLPGIGVIARGAAAQAGDIIIFWSNKGFYKLEAGARATPLGEDQFDEFLKADLDRNYLDRISAVADPASRRIFFAYPGAGNSGGRPNRLLAVDPVSNRVAPIDQEVELLAQIGGTAISLDAAATPGDPDEIDGVEGSLDDPRWAAGPLALAAFDADFKSGFFDGDKRTATIETREFALHEGYRTRLNGFRALVDGGTITAQIGTRNDLAQAASFGPVLNARRAGRFTRRSNAAYHRFRFQISGDWRHAIGMLIDPQDLRQGEARG
jgi:hypothetical protein